MSTNKTQNYQLHAWEPGDDFLLSEINANFAKLDQLIHSRFSALPKGLKLVVGSYEGDDTQVRNFDVGFRPKMVLVAATGLYDGHNTLLSDGLPNLHGEITDTGFQVDFYMNWKASTHYNYGGEVMNPFRYYAFWWED